MDSWVLEDSRKYVVPNKKRENKGKHLTSGIGEEEAKEVSTRGVKRGRGKVVRRGPRFNRKN